MWGTWTSLALTWRLRNWGANIMWTQVQIDWRSKSQVSVGRNFGKVPWLEHSTQCVLPPPWQCTGVFTVPGLVFSLMSFSPQLRTWNTWIPSVKAREWLIHGISLENGNVEVIFCNSQCFRLWQQMSLFSTQKNLHKYRKTIKVLLLKKH